MARAFKSLGATSIPDGWRLARLEDMADISFSSVDKKTTDGEVPIELCNYTDVFYNRRIRVGMKLMAATATPAERDTWSLKKGDVLFTKDSETPDEIGVPSYVSDDMPNVLCGYHLGLARSSSGLAYGTFLARALASRESVREFSRIANGVTRFGLTLDATRKLPILLPPLAEQRAIAAVLDAIDEAIERTEAVIAATEHLRDALLHELLTRGVPGWHTAWKEAPGLGTIPACWEVVRLGEVAGFEQGGTPSKSQETYWEGHIPFVTGADLRDFRIGRNSARTFLTEGGLNSGATVICKPGSLLLATRTRVGLAGIAVETMGASQDITLVKPGGRADTAYLCRLLISHSKKLQQMSRGTSIQGISREDVSSFSIVLPPLMEQQAIATALDGVDEAMEKASQERDGLQLLKASAADALLSGRVRVEVGD